MSPREGVIGWARRLFEDEPELRPCLFGLDQIPLIRDERSARRQPALAVLSAVFRAETERVAEHLELALLGLRALPAWQRGQYVALLEETIQGDIMDEILEKLAREAEAENEEAIARSYGSMKRRREAEAREEGREEGRLSGLRDALWLLVELRGLEVDDRQRAEVEACASSEQLSRWLARLKTVERFADALGD